MPEAFLIPVFILAFSIAMLYLMPAAEGVVYEIKPSLTVSGQYNDNIFLTSKDERDEFITRTMPAIKLKYEAPRWSWDVDYTLDYRNYANKAHKDELAQELALRGRVEALKGFLYIALRDEFRRVSLDAARDFSVESLFLNQSDRNIFAVNPYLRVQIHPAADVRAGYVFSDIEYSSGKAVDKRDSARYVESNIELSASATFNAGYRRTERETGAGDFEKDDLYAGYEYEYKDGSRVFLSGGNAWVDFEDGASESWVFWDAGIAHGFGAFKALIDTASLYDENPGGNPLKVNRYTFALEGDFERSDARVSLSLKEFRDAVTDIFLTKIYGVKCSLRRELTGKMAVSTGAALDRYDFIAAKFEAERILLDAGLDYTLMEDLQASFAYRYQGSDSDDRIPLGNYENNRVTISIRKDF